jgi:2-oxoglutarate ferredoxin oxidoreductase subunit alpha
MPRELNFMVGGEAGQGVQAAGFILAKTLARGGYNVFADQDYESRVRGGHNFFRVRCREGQVGAVCETVDILIALNRETIDLHVKELAGDGVAVFDDGGAGAGVDSRFLGIPMERIARDAGGSDLMANTVALGAALGVAGCDLGIATETVRDFFGPGPVGEANAAAIAAGRDYASAHLEGLPRRELPRPGGGRRMLMNGNEALALGAVAAGCRFMAAYPMTPATSIMEYLANKAEDLGVVVLQPEDEIAAVNMVVGAAFAGVRSMTATSGSGFCLMVEGLGLAGMTETPIVIVDAQRPGPAIGLPTRTEQSDLEFVVHASHGEFPRAVLAPATVEQAFWLTAKAFNLAEKYQLPVIVLTDQHLASSYATVEKFDPTKIGIDRGELLSIDQARSGDHYKRHLMTGSGVSPRSLPFEARALVATDADEHDEDGHMIEQAEIRTAMVQKRLRKMKGLLKDIGPPLVYGSRGAEVTLVGWGSTFGALREAVELGIEDGLDVNLVHFSEIWPFPGESAADVLSEAKRVYTVENNATGQLARIIRGETGQQVSGEILKFDGRPFSPADVLGRLRELVR